jgi:hypothetical protein
MVVVLPTVNAGVDGADQSSGCLRTRTRTFTATDAAVILQPYHDL